MGSYARGVIRTGAARFRRDRDGDPERSPPTPGEIARNIGALLFIALSVGFAVNFTLWVTGH